LLSNSAAPVTLGGIGGGRNVQLLGLIRSLLRDLLGLELHLSGLDGVLLRHRVTLSYHVSLPLGSGGLFPGLLAALHLLVQA
jgi:hypothetical protein